MNQMLRQKQNIHTNKDERACSKRDKQQKSENNLHISPYTPLYDNHHQFIGLNPLTLIHELELH